MDYKSLLSLAEKKQEMNSNNKFNIKKKSMNGSYTSGPDKSVIDAFKARREREEMEKRVKAHKERERLLSLRAQNSKSMRKAKMMKTRTKDNDFSRIVLTEEQVEEQRRVEEKLKRKGITDLCQRMKTRIDLEEEESSVPKKKQRVRNSNNSNNSNINSSNSYISSQNGVSIPKIDKQIKSKINNNSEEKKNENKAKSRPEKPTMSYQQLLSLASEKAKTEKKSLSDELLSEMDVKKQIRPMTQKEKDSLKEELFYKSRANKGLARLPNAEEIKKLKLQENRRDFNKNQTIPKSNLNMSSTKSEAVRNGAQRSPVHTKQSQNTIPRNNDSINRIQNNGSNQRPVDKSLSDRQRMPQNRTDLKKPIQSSQSNKSEIIKKMDNRMNERMNLKKQEMERDRDNYEKYSSNLDKERQRDSEYRPRDPEYKARDQEYRPRDPGYRPRDPEYRARDSEYRPRDPEYRPGGPEYRPGGPEYKPGGPEYRPGGPEYKARNQEYRPRDPEYRARDQEYRPRDPEYRTRDQEYRPRDPEYRARDPEYRPRVPEYRPRDLGYNNDSRYERREINERARVPSPPTRPVSRLPPIGSTYRRGMYEDVAQYVADDDDYEEEDDDDMSDFIDDGPEEKPAEEDYSRAIREIFGYDKRKYRNIEDDDDIEEANFAQCMKEESRSLRIGIQEDLEDIRQEEEEKKRKLLEKKKAKR